MRDERCNWFVLRRTRVMTDMRSVSRTTLALAVCLSLAACNGDGFNPFGGSRGADAAVQDLPPPPPDARGVITYATYQVIVAQPGDTIPTMAARIGLTGEEIARHNGLPVTYIPREGEVLALPGNVGGDPVTTSIWSPDIVTGALDAAPGAVQTSSLDPLDSSALPAPGAPSANNPFNNGQTDRVIEPRRHRVQPGETAFSIAQQYGVSVTALASWNGLDNNMTIRSNQELLIPIVNGSTPAPLPPVAAAPVETPVETLPQPAANPPGTPTPIPPPPSADAPLPADQNIDEVETPPSPNLAQNDAPPPATGGQLLPPVPGGNVLRGYDPDGPARNEGIDFAAPAGTAVTAAEGGEIALISESLGGLGTIVLIRHPDNLMTVYGRVTDVSLQKGDRVTRGQQIGVVADGDTPNVHFEVRRGTASVDPSPFLAR